MIISEIIFDGKLIKRYSDAGFFIRQDQTGIDYPEAIDIIDSPYTYTETDIPIEDPESNPDNPDPIEPDPVEPDPITPEPDEPDTDEPDPIEPEPIYDSDDDLLSIYEAYDMLLGGD